MHEAKPITVYVHKAQPVGEAYPVPSLCVLAEKQIEGFKTLEEQAKFAAAEAEELVKALIDILPGCTIDQILIALLKAKASHFRVTHRS